MATCDLCGKEGLTKDKVFGISAWKKSVEDNADEELKLCRACYDKKRS